MRCRFGREQLRRTQRRLGIFVAPLTDAPLTRPTMLGGCERNHESTHPAGSSTSAFFRRARGWCGAIECSARGSSIARTGW